MGKRAMCCAHQLRVRLWIVLFSTFMFPILTAHCNALSIDKALIRDAKTTYSYYLDQQYSVDEIIRQFPVLKQAAKESQSAFDSVFSDSLQHMDDVFSNRREWKQLKLPHRRQLDNHISLESISFEQAEDYLQLLNKRAKGKIQSPMIETLLMFDPVYQVSPDLEFSNGYRKKFIATKKNEASAALFSMDYPASWQAMDAKKPNATKKFVSENGRGTATVWVLVKEIKLPIGEKVTKKDIKGLLNPQDLADLLPRHAVHVSSGMTDIELLPGFWQRFRMKKKGRKQREGIAYTVYHRNKVIQIQCVVEGQKKRAENLSQQFSTYEPVFKLMAESVFIPGVYF